MKRIILHIDMDAFFASVEQHDHPEWKGLPVVVGAPPDRRGVVSTCSYEARVYGIHSAMSSQEAYRRCPTAIFVVPRMARYQAVSEAIFEIFSRFSPDVEPLSVDEAFIDISGVQRLFGSPEVIAAKIKDAILHETGLTCSIGVAPNKFLAKLASEEKKPDGFFRVPEQTGALLTWLGDKPLRALWGVGPKLAALLNAKGLHTVRDIQESDPTFLRSFLTEGSAAHLLNMAFGRDARPVETEHEEKSLSREHTYPEDIQDREQLRHDLRLIAEDVGLRLRAAHLRAKTGKIKIRYAGFRTVTRQASFQTPVCDDFALRDMAYHLLDLHLEEEPVRLIGFGVDNLIPEADLFPDDLFTLVGENHSPREKEEKLSATLDTLRQRFGSEMFRGTP